MSSEERRAADAVDQDRLWQRLMAMGEIGGTPRGGVNRPALSALDAEARRLLVDWGRDLGLQPSQDAIGNLFLRLPGQDDTLPPVMSGSHLDSQPTGGKFDGAFGVIAAFEAVEAIVRCGIECRRPIEIVSWTNEEGSRFQPGTTGSNVFVGSFDLEQTRTVVDWEGTTVGEAVDAVVADQPDLPMRSFGFPIHAFVELHIEQGPLLETEGIPVGIVTRAQGSRRFSVEITGEEAHAGTMPLRRRKDALKIASRMIGALDVALHDPEDVVRFTVGRMDVSPGSPNTVPGRVTFTIDLRHPETAVLERLTGIINETCAAEAAPCGVSVVQLSDTKPVVFDTGLTGSLARHAEALGLGHREMISGAGHDAMMLSRHCPSAMLFSPCRDGISHNEAEWAEAGDLTANARVLAATLVELARA